MQRLTKQCDWLDIIIFVGVMTTFTMTISFGGSVYDWDFTSEIVFWVLAGVLIITFFLIQYFHPFVSAEYKLYSTNFFKMPVMVSLQVLMVCAAVDLFVSWLLIRLDRVIEKRNMALYVHIGADLLHPFLFSIFSDKPHVRVLAELYRSGFTRYRGIRLWKRRFGCFHSSSWL